MVKKIFALLLLFTCIPVFAGELESALAKNKKVFLYLYTPECGICTRFSPRYSQIAKEYNQDYTFIKMDASTPYGYSIFRRFGGRYVPYVIVFDSKNKAGEVNLNCLVSAKCTDKVLKSIK